MLLRRDVEDILRDVLCASFDFNEAFQVLRQMMFEDLDMASLLYMADGSSDIYGSISAAYGAAMDLLFALY